MELQAYCDALEAALHRRGVVLREEDDLPRGAGGYCVLRGVPTVLLDRRAPLSERSETLLSALRRVGPGEIWLPPVIRERLEDPSP